MGALLAAFRNSLRGFWLGARSERAIRQELLALAAALPIAFFVAARPLTFALLIGVLILLLAVEVLNTAIEKLCDHITLERHPQIGFVKDLGSAAVLCILVLVGLVWGTALLEWLLR